MTTKAHHRASPKARAAGRGRPPIIGVRPQGQLYRATDYGHGVTLDPLAFGGRGEEGWGQAYESFRRLNEPALAALGVSPRFESSARGPVLRLWPGGHVGAIPLRSGTTGHVVAGFVVGPRFGWGGIGELLASTGFHASPRILAVPLVPGSGREVPPWVIAGPVLARLQQLLDTLKRGFDFAEATMTRPRGTIRWPHYARHSLPSGRWHHLPCRFPELAADPTLRAAIRWTLERLLETLTGTGSTDRVAQSLRMDAGRLIHHLLDVAPTYPRRELVRQLAPSDPLIEAVVRDGLEAIGWVRDERGLGGGRQMDGLAWCLPLDQLWENHVAAIVRERVRTEGGTLRLGRRSETVTPLHWSDTSHHSLGHLVPDIVVQRNNAVWVVDAKYKSHFADIDEDGWKRMAHDIRESHRADLHQILAYSSLFDAPEITATLAYPLRHSTWEGLRARGLDCSEAQVYAGSRHIRLQLWGLPFSASGRAADPD